MGNNQGQDQNQQRRCGFVAVLGLPNAGKSTLINALVGEKVTITSRKSQTTRMQLRGIALEGMSQIVLIDTPGIFKPKARLDFAMVEAAWAGLEEAELCLLIVDASKKDAVEAQAPLLKRLKEAGKPVWLILNKVDRMRKEDLLGVTAALNAQYDFAHTLMISATKESGVGDLRAALAKAMPESEWAYPEDMVSDMPSRLLAAEVTREQIFDRLHDELPYAIHVETESWEAFDNGDIKISQVVYVHRDSQKAIILGKGGRQIKDIGAKAREELGRMFETKVHLSLFVKVDERWQDNPERYAFLGLSFN